MCDGEGALGDPDDGKRRQAVLNHHKWADAARFLGCHSIRVNAETRDVGSFEEQQKRAADGLAQLSEYCGKLGLNCIVENHGGLASNGANIDAVHMHLHHVLNCLVGPGGNGFDAGQANPCMGSGPAIPQTADAAMKTKLEGAATQARGGIANADVAAAKKTASDIQAMLK